MVRQAHHERTGNTVWKFDEGGSYRDAERLVNGNTLIVDGRAKRVIEVTPKGKVVWKLEGLNRPNDADRLPNGHTLVAQSGEVAEFDAKGKKVWSAKVGLPVAVSRY